MTDRATIADASKMSPLEFWRTIHAERYAKREKDARFKAALQAAIDDGDLDEHARLLTCCITGEDWEPYSELKRTGTGGWL